MGLLDSVGDLASALANPFGLPSKGQWNLIEGSFTTKTTQQTVVFFFEKTKGGDRTQRTGLEQVSDGGGRRKAIYEYPYRDGQSVDDLGRRGEKFTFNLTFFGSNYQTLFKNFINVVVSSKESGILSHPVRGQIPCAFQEYEFVHRHDQFNAVTIRATFIEDNQDVLKNANLQTTSSNSALRNALQTLTNAQSFIGTAIATVSAALLLPNAIESAMKSRLSSIVGGLSGLFSQLAATFSSDAQLQALAAKAAQVNGGVTALSSGTTTSSSTGASTGQSLPPVFQVGFGTADTQSIQAMTSQYISNNQLTPQQAVYQMNQVRAQISEAIQYTESQFSVSGFDIVLTYRQLAVQFQAAIEAAISSTSNTVILYTIPYPMSLRNVAFLNGLDTDRQNDIAALNPTLDSINFVLQGTVLVVPSS
jgi:prophage DNA circulation protein